MSVVQFVLTKLFCDEEACVHVVTVHNTQHHKKNNNNKLTAAAATIIIASRLYVCATISSRSRSRTLSMCFFLYICIIKINFVARVCMLCRAIRVERMKKVECKIEREHEAIFSYNLHSKFKQQGRTFKERSFNAKNELLHNFQAEIWNVWNSLREYHIKSIRITIGVPEFDSVSVLERE